jgi:hypothetical protein
MSNQHRLIVAIVFVVALLGGGAIALGIIGGGGGSGASPSPVAVVSPSASAAPSASASASVEPTVAPSPSNVPSPSASVEPSATPQPTPSPTVGPGRPTTIVLEGLKLDADEDPNGKNRRLAFRSQGTGVVTVRVTVRSPQGSAVLCLRADGEQPECKTTGDGGLNAQVTTRRADFVLTVRGAGIEAPIVDVTVAFPARNPSLTVTNARFDGTLYPDTNGIRAIIAPREDGDVTLEAEWGGHPLSYEIDLREQDGPGAHVLADQGPSTGVTQTLPVTAANPWRLVLQNSQEGFGVTPLEATISWP